MADHLFFPEKPQKPLRIEYRGPLYDGGEWDEYPTRHGWRNEKGDIEWIDFMSKHGTEVECWLYFGMLFYVFGEKLNQADFLRSEENEDDLEGPKQFLTTTHLRDYVDDVKEWKNKRYGERAVTIVEKVCKELDTFKDTSLRDEMKLAIRLICHVLWNISVKRDGPRTLPHDVSKWLLSDTYETVRMIKSEWCPWEVMKSRFTGGYVDTIAYLLQLNRKKATWDNRSHAACKLTECVAHNIDESNYLMRHVTEGCGCDHLQADVEQLHTVLKDGGIPLVKITPLADEDGDARFKIEIVRKRTGRQYVAISHVWSDGMGNPNGNSLPHCQVRLLYEQARRLVTDKEYIPRLVGDPLEHIEVGASRLAHFAFNQARGKDKSVLVWIDTLCIPHQRDVRSLAIQRIRPVYLDAYRVLILDSEMRQVESNSISRTQLLIRVVFCSGWMRRLWTLQEGLAAKYRLYMLFSDKPINIATIAEEMLTKIEKNKLPILQERVAWHAMSVWFLFFKESIDYASKLLRTLDVLAKPFMEPGSDKSSILSGNWYNVGTRTATKPGDRPIILAGVLDLDVKPILDAKGGPEERMRAFYRMLDEFPCGILFEEEPRFEDDGMRWAVKACQYSSMPHYLGGAAGKITPRGLQVSSLSSWLFPSVVALNISSEDFQSTSGDWLIQHNLKDVTKADACTLHFKNSVKLMPDKTYGVILEREESYTGQSCSFALVEHQSTEADNVHYAQYVGVGTARRVAVWGLLPRDGYLLPFGFKSLEKRVWVIG